MLCILFGAFIAAITYGYLGNWAALAGIGAAAGLYFTMKFWPQTKKPNTPDTKD